MPRAPTTRRKRDPRTRGRKPRAVASMRIGGVHPAVPAVVLGNVVYQKNSLTDLTADGAAWLIRTHPLGVVRRTSQGRDPTYLVVTGLRSWQVLEGLRCMGVTVPRTVPVIDLGTLSAEEVRAVALADLLVASRYFALAPDTITAQTGEILRQMGEALVRKYLTPGEDLLPLLRPPTPPKRGRPSKKPK